MVSGKVTIKEIDQSTRVPSFPGIVGAIAIEAKKGAVNEKTLITSENQLLLKMTPDNTIKVGYDLAYFSALNFLSQSNQLYVIRAANNPLYGGLLIYDTSSASNHAPFATGASQADIDSWTFGNNECMIIYGESPGKFNDDIYISIEDYSSKEPDSFKLRVWKASTTGFILLEEWVCSRIEGKKDGFGQNIYVNDVLKGSLYIRGLNNPSIDGTLLPKTTTQIALGSGDDGGTVTASNLQQAIDAVRNKEETYITLLLDGGHYEDVAYQQYLDGIAQERQDCVAILSVPYNLEHSSNYLTDIINWKQSTLLLDSSSYSALYTSHCLAYDKFNDRKIYLPPDGYAGSVLSFTATKYESWFAGAGWKRGTIRVEGLKRIYSEGERDALDEAGINPIRYKPGRGIAIWGNRTVLGRPSLLRNLNVRMLMITFEPFIADALETFLFDQNDDITRRTVKALIEDECDSIKGRRGIYDYFVTCDQPGDPGFDPTVLNVWLYVKPIPAIDWIKFNVVVTRYGFDFKLAGTTIRT